MRSHLKCKGRSESVIGNLAASTEVKSPTTLMCIPSFAPALLEFCGESVGIGKRMDDEKDIRIASRVNCLRLILSSDQQTQHLFCFTLRSSDQKKTTESAVRTCDINQRKLPPFSFCLPSHASHRSSSFSHLCHPSLFSLHAAAARAFRTLHPSQTSTAA